MHLWTWVLIALSLAGVLLALTSSLRAMLLGLRLRRRLASLRNSALVTDLESLQTQVDRLGRSAGKAAQLQSRTSDALTSIQGSIRASGADVIGESIRQARAELRALAEDLR